MITMFDLATFGHSYARELELKNFDPLIHTARILIIEDQPDEIRLLLEEFQTTQFHFSIAFDAMQGYGRAVAQRPDLILLDVRLGSSDGFSVCRLLKADPSTADIQVIFLTALGTLEDKLTGIQAGAVDYILKPFEPAEVLARICLHLKIAPVEPPCSPVASPHPEKKSDQYIARAAACQVVTNLARMPRLAEIARRLGTNEKRLTHVFKTQKGMSVFEFVRQQRLLLARKLLTQTPLCVADIAAETGFSSSANFAAAFRATFGLAPNQYRHEQAGAQLLSAVSRTRA